MSQPMTITSSYAANALHGGRIQAARRAFPSAPEPFVDLSTGINPVPYPLPSIPIDAFARLPEPESLDTLLAAAAQAYDVASTDMVVAAPGTQILINLLPLLFRATTVAVLSPTYNEHAACWRAGGAQVHEASDLADIGQAEIVVLCNPNNPDGRRYDRRAVQDLLAHQAAHDGWVVIDEAFADLEDAALGAASLLPHPRLLILRSFGKTYGLAGIRLGFLLAAAAHAERVRQALGPWAVSGPAITIGATALQDTAWRALIRRHLADSTSRLDALLTQAGLRIIGGTHLFRLAEHPDAPALYRALGQAGILVRPFSDHPSWLRFGLPGYPAAWDRLADALKTTPER